MLLERKNSDITREVSLFLSGLTDFLFEDARDIHIHGSFSLYNALVGFMYNETQNTDSTFSNLETLLSEVQYRDYDDKFKNPVDLMFDDFSKEEKNTINYFKHYKCFMKITVKIRQEVAYMSYYTLVRLNEYIEENNIVNTNFSNLDDIKKLFEFDGNDNEEVIEK